MGQCGGLLVVRATRLSSPGFMLTMSSSSLFTVEPSSVHVSAVDTQNATHISVVQSVRVLLDSFLRTGCGHVVSLTVSLSFPCSLSTKTTGKRARVGVCEPPSYCIIVPPDARTVRVPRPVIWRQFFRWWCSSGVPRVRSRV